jgi:hypothetical protein
MASAVNIDLAGAGDLIKSVGGLAGQIRSAITGDLSPEAKASLEAAAIQADNAVELAQAAINSEEAKSSNFFVSGWRPAVGWSCAIAVFVNFIVVWVMKVINPNDAIPTIDSNLLYPLMLGMLGIGTMRTVEKVNGVQNNH